MNARAYVQAAADCGATAVHPGYGFLSESPEYVAAVEGAGMQWLGPRGKTMFDFALKHVAKDMAVAAGVPTLEGSPLVATAEGVRSCRAVRIAGSVPLHAISYRTVQC